MNCKDFEKKLYESLFGLSNGELKKELEDHYTSCPRCENYYQSTLKVYEVLKFWRSIQPSPLLSARTFEKIQKARQQEHPKKPSRSRLPLVLRKYGTLAATVIFFLSLVGALLVFYLGPNPQSVIVLMKPSFFAGSQGALQVLVLNRKTNSPLSGAEVEISLQNNKNKNWNLGKFSTNSRGTLDCSFKVPPDLRPGSYRIKVQVASRLDTEEVVSSLEIKSPTRIFLHTDKLVYSPGEKVFGRVVALSGYDYTPNSSLPLEVVWSSPQGYLLGKQEIKTSTQGEGLFSFPLGKRVPTGQYHLKILGPGKEKKLSFYVGKPAGEGDFVVKSRWMVRGKNFLTPELPSTELEVEVLSLQNQPLSNHRLKIYLPEGVEANPSSVLTDGRGRGRIKLALKNPSALKLQQVLPQTLEVGVISPQGRGKRIQKKLYLSPVPLFLQALVDKNRILPDLPNNHLRVLCQYPDGTKYRGPLMVTFSKSQREVLQDGREKVDIPRGAQKVEVKVLGQKFNPSLTLNLAKYIPKEWLSLQMKRAFYDGGESVALEVLSTRRKGLVFLDLLKNGQVLASYSGLLFSQNQDPWGRCSFTLKIPPRVSGTLQLHAYQITTRHFRPPAHEVYAEGTSDLPLRDSRIIFVRSSRDLTFKDLPLKVKLKNQSLEFQVLKQGKVPAQSSLTVWAHPVKTGALPPARSPQKIYFQVDRRFLSSPQKISRDSLSEIVEGKTSQESLLISSPGLPEIPVKLDSYEEKANNWDIQQDAWFSLCLILGVFSFYLALWGVPEEKSTRTLSILLISLLFLSLKGVGCAQKAVISPVTLNWKTPASGTSFKGLPSSEFLPLAEPSEGYAFHIKTSHDGAATLDLSSLSPEKNWAFSIYCLSPEGGLGSTTFLGEFPPTFRGRLFLPRMALGRSQVRGSLEFSNPFGERKTLTLRFHTKNLKFIHLPPSEIHLAPRETKTLPLVLKGSSYEDEGTLVVEVGTFDKRTLSKKILLLANQPTPTPPTKTARPVLWKGKRKLTLTEPVRWIKLYPSLQAFLSEGSFWKEKNRISRDHWLDRFYGSLFFPPARAHYISEEKNFSNLAFYLMALRYSRKIPLSPQEISKGLWEGYHFLLSRAALLDSQRNNLEIAWLLYLLYELKLSAKIQATPYIKGLTVDSKLMGAIEKELFKRQDQDGSWPVLTLDEDLAQNEHRLHSTAFVAYFLQMCGIKSPRIQKALNYLKLNITSKTEIRPLALCAHALALSGEREEVLKKILNELVKRRQIQGENCYWKGETREEALRNTALTISALATRYKYSSTAFQGYQYLLSYQSPQGSFGSPLTDFWVLRSLLPLFLSQKEEQTPFYLKVYQEDRVILDKVIQTSKLEKIPLSFSGPLEMELEWGSGWHYILIGMKD